MANVTASFIDTPIFKSKAVTYQKEFASRLDLKPGSARWSEDDIAGIRLLYVCPSGCGAINAINVYTGPAGHGWQWDGNLDKPTLSTDIQQVTPCRWHGFLKGGEFITIDQAQTPVDRQPVPTNA